MSSVIRAVVVYLVLLFVFRMAGKRTLAKITTFDLVLTLIISEAVQQSLLGHDGSMTNGFLVVLTLVGADIALSLIKHRFPNLRRLIDGQPVVVVRDGELVRESLDQERVEKSDILAGARESLGLGRLADIRHAVIEESGGITVIRREKT
jgi:uncharacterized membrane protein YcaP (DUF421 family)